MSGGTVSGGTPTPARRGLRARLRRRTLLVVTEAVLPAALVALWYVTSARSTDFYFPPLSRILRTFATLWTGSAFGEHVVPSLGRAGAGFALAVVFGVGAGLVMGLSRRTRAVLEPLVEFSRAVPPPLLVPVAILALGIGNSMKIVVIVAGGVWPVLLNTVEGVRGLDPVLADTARSYRITGWERVRRIVLPGAAPQIMAGVRTCLALSLILMVISEMIGSNNGIGFFVQQAQRGFDLPQMWAGILLLGLIGYLSHLVFSVVERRILAWHRGSRASSRSDT